ncbi:thiamine ABC transporter substrate binding subunit [Actinomyces faecalis]|uniref:thiamine ABC transporter substrate-binding protein n=1 Tax=Actinomyces faecalis TaxID=2722820 RepID=UPI001557F168|nr:thiamine ABC transporter substrate-binding protein [Actinomyces faecalis]
MPQATHPITHRVLTPTRRQVLGALGLGAVGASLAACGSKKPGGTASSTSSQAAGAGSGRKVTVLTHDSFHVPDELVAAFEKDTGYTLEIVPSGDAGELVNKLVLTKDAPLGDAVFGIDNTFASRALDEGVIDTSVTVTLPGEAEQYVVGSTPALTPIDFGEVCLNVDTAWFADKGLTPPATFEDLTKEDYKDLFVAINPSTSSTGLAFLLATIGHFGEDGFAGYWKDLVANGAKIDEGWTDAYYTDFSGGGEGGTYPIVVSYSSSPAATVSEDGTSSSTASVLTTAFRQVEYAGALAGGANPEGAKAFIEWMLSADVQTSIPDNMYMYPVNPEATLSKDMMNFGQVSDSPITVEADAIAANREAWLATWTEAVGA